MERFDGVRGLLFGIEITLFGGVYGTLSVQPGNGTLIAAVGLLIAIASVFTFGTRGAAEVPTGDAAATQVTD